MIKDCAKPGPENIEGELGQYALLGCSSLYCIARYCTKVGCTTLHYTGLHCIELHCISEDGSVYSAVMRNTRQCSINQCSAVQIDVKQCSAIQHSIM